MASYEYVIAYYTEPIRGALVEVERIPGDIDERLVEQYRFCKCKVYGWFANVKKERKIYLDEHKDGE